MSENKDNINSQQLALVATSNDDTRPPNNSEVANALSHPKNLQDLLKLSTSLHTAQTPSSQQTDPSRANFLREALSSLSVDVVAELKKRLDKLRDLTNEQQTKNKDFAIYEETFEEIIDQVESIDLAMAFYQIGGLEVVSQLLQHSHPTVQASAANIIATCCRNNPYCQLQSIQPAVFVPLIRIAEEEPNLNTKFQAISAISAIVRDNPQGIQMFRKYNGFVFLNNAMESANEKLIIKASYFISALCDTDSTVKDDLVKMGIVEKLISLVRLTSGLIVEHFLRSLVSLTREHSLALQQCLKKEYMFYTCLTYLNSKSKEDDTYQDVGELASLLRAFLLKEAETLKQEGKIDESIYDLTMCPN